MVGGGPTKPAAEILGRDNYSGGLDIDFEDESGAQAAAAEADAELAIRMVRAEIW